MPWSGIGPCPVLAERDEELAVLAETARLAEHGRPALLLVSGEAGAGKTRLCREFIESLPDGWVRVFVGGGDGVRSVPFRGLVDTAPMTSEPAHDLGTALAAALRDHARPGPVVAMFEDMHVVDPVGLAALRHALQALGGVPAALLVAYRLGEHAPGSPHARALEALLDESTATEVRLGPLSPRGVAELARGMGFAELSEDAAAVDALHQTTGGNPFFVEELLRSPDPGVPWTVREAVMARIEPLGDIPGQVARVLAVARAPLPLAVLADLVPHAEPALTRLVDAELAVRGEDGSAALRHALVVETVERDIDTAERLRLHHLLATALERRPNPEPERLTRHWSEAGDPVAAARWATVAAEMARDRRAYRTATELYHIALASPPSDQAERASLLERAAISAGMAGAIVDAVTWAEEAAAAGRTPGDEWRAITLWLNPALENIPRASVPTDADPAGMVDAARHALQEGDPDRAIRHASMALPLLENDRDADLRRLAAMTLFYAGDVEAGRRELAAVRDWAEAGGRVRDLVMTYADMSRVAWSLGDIEESCRVDRLAVTMARHDPEAVYWPQVQGGLACILALRGDFDEALALAAEIEALAIPLVTEMARFVTGLVDVERGDLDRARDPIEKSAALGRLIDVPHLLALILTVRARLHQLAGEHEQARADLAEAGAAIGGVLEETLPDRLLLSARVAEALGASDDLVAARSAANDLARFATSPAVTGVADAIDGITARAKGDARAAALRFEAAARAWERSPRPVLAAEAWCEAAEAGIRARSLGSAGSAVERAAALSRRLRVHRLDARIEAATAAVRAAVPRLSSEFDRLTPREVQIVRLVGAGRTNRQIAEALHISELTARNHLSNVLTKLSLSRRTEVAAVAAQMTDAG